MKSWQLGLAIAVASGTFILTSCGSDKRSAAEFIQ